MADLGEIRTSGNSVNGPRGWSQQVWDSVAAWNPGSFGSDGDQTSFLMEDTPSDFESMDTLTWEVWLRKTNSGDDEVGLRIRVVKESDGTVLAAADSGGTFQVVNLTHTSTLHFPYNGSFDFVNTSATKADWDDMRWELESAYNQIMSPDEALVQVGPSFDASGFQSFLGGTYTAASAGGGTAKAKVGGTFVEKPVLAKVGGTFVEKPLKKKVGGVFV